MQAMTDDENICRNAAMLILGDQYAEQIQPIKAAVGLIASAKQLGFRDAAAHLADVAKSEGEPPIVVSMFIAAGAELAIAT